MRYSTLAEGEDEWGVEGCAVEAIGIYRYEGRYYYVGQGPQGHEYYADQCAHVCQEAVLYRPTFQGPYLWDRGANIGFIVYYCKRNLQGSTLRGLCVGP